MIVKSCVIRGEKTGFYKNCHIAGLGYDAILGENTEKYDLLELIICCK